MMASPKVSVLIITYNHEAYIEQAVESVLMQQVDFNFELIISEDCSTDATRKIVMEFQRKWPERIRLLLSDRNQFDNEVFTRGILAARGQYIALLEGDDFWTSPQKLQKQVDFLESHRDCVSCFHDVMSTYEPGVKYEECSPFRPKTISTLRDLLEQGCFIETGTVMFRSGLITEFPDWFRHVYCSDWLLHVFTAERGHIGYIDEVLAAHRYHAGGVWTSLDTVGRLEKTIEAYVALQEHFKGAHARILRKGLMSTWYGLAVAHLASGQAAVARDCAKHGLMQQPYNPRLLTFLYAPWLWQITRSVRGWARS